MSNSSATGESGDDLPLAAIEEEKSSSDKNQETTTNVFVKGAATGWIKAKGLLRHLSSSSSADVPKESPVSPTFVPTSPTWSASFFANLSPEMCVNLLRHNSPKIYKNIRRRISNADNDWMEAFFRANGLNVLFEMLEELTDSGKFGDTSLGSVILPMYCVECVKSIMKNRHNMELIVNEPEYIYKLVHAIGSEKFAVRSNAVQLLSALAYFSEQGCQVILDGLHKFQQKWSKKFWTEILVDELQNSDLDYKASLMALINCIMFNVDFDKRSKIRNELLAVGLKDLLQKLHDEARAAGSDRLAVQLNLFDEYRQKDQKNLEPKVAGKIGADININDHYELFAALMQRIGNSPYSASLLTILQSLSFLDLDAKCCYQQWDIIEQFIAAVCSLDCGGQNNDLSDLLNSLQQNLNNLFCKSFATSQTQTDGEICNIKNTAGNDNNNNNDLLFGSNGERIKQTSNAMGKKRSGFKKKLSSLLHFNHHNTKNTGQEENSIISDGKKSSNKKKKPKASYKVHSRRVPSGQSRLVPEKTNAVSMVNVETETERILDSSSQVGGSKEIVDETRLLSSSAKPPRSLQEKEAIISKRPTGSTKSTTKPCKMRCHSLSAMLDENACALLSCKKLIGGCPTSTADQSENVDTLIATNQSLFMTAAEDPTTLMKSTSPKLTKSLISKAAATSSRAPPPAPPPPPLFLIDQKFAEKKVGQENPKNQSIKVPPPAPPPPPLFLANQNAQWGQLVPPSLPVVSQSVRPIIPAPTAMLADTPVRGGPRAPPLPPPPPPPPPGLTCGGAGKNFPPPPPPFLLAGGDMAQQKIIGMSQAAPDIPKINERFYTFPKEKCKKTKTLYWNKLAPAALVQKKNNLWCEKVDESMDSVNFSKIEELFCCETQPSTSSGKRASSDQTASNDPNNEQGGSTNPTLPKILDQVYILDQKTSLKISLFLKQFRGLSLEQIVDMVVKNDASPGTSTGGRKMSTLEEHMSLERLRGLQKCLVGVEQYIIDVQNYDGDYAKLGMAEKFIWHIGQHKFFALRLDVKCLQKEFDDKFKNFASLFDTLIDCCNNLRNNESLRNFLFLTLRVGNYLNLGSASGPAAGFKISSVKQLYALKATGQSSTSLLHFLVEDAENATNVGGKNPLEFTVQLADIHKATKIDYEATKAELMSWSTEIRKLIQTARSSTDPIFVQQNDIFLNTIEESLKDLTLKKIQEVEASTKSLQEYFCDELKLSDLLNVFSEFLKSVERAKVDNDSRKLKEERLAKRKEQQEMKKANTVASNIKRSSSSTEDSLVENLLTIIRNGDIAPKTKDYNSCSSFEGLHGLKRSTRNFTKSVIGDQSRERSNELSNLR